MSETERPKSAPALPCDGYTKAMLTIIAIALVVLAL